MKRVFMVSILVNSCFILQAQNTHEEKSARRIADTIQDSLSLTNQQKQQIYVANIKLHQDAKKLQKQYESMDSLAFYMKKIEVRRDSLYQSLLSSDKYQLYKQKKVRLINSY